MTVSAYRVVVLSCDAPGCSLQLTRVGVSKYGIRPIADEEGWYRGAVDLCPAHHKEYQRRGLLQEVS